MIIPGFAGGPSDEAAIVEFINVSGTSAAGTEVDVAAATESGDLVVVWGGNTTHVDVNWDAGVDLEDGNSGAICAGCGYTVPVADNTHVFTSSASLHRAATATFRGASEVQSEAPEFGAQSTNITFVGFPGGTVPEGGGRVLLMSYNTATNGGVTPPAGFTTIRGHGFTPAFLSNDVLTEFNGAVGTSTNSVFSATLTAVVLV